MNSTTRFSLMIFEALSRVMMFMTVGFIGRALNIFQTVSISLGLVIGLFYGEWGVFFIGLGIMATQLVLLSIALSSSFLVHNLRVKKKIVCNP